LQFHVVGDEAVHKALELQLRHQWHHLDCEQLDLLYTASLLEQWTLPKAERVDKKPNQ